MRNEKDRVLCTHQQPSYAEGAGILLVSGELVESAGGGQQALYLTLRSLYDASPVGVTVLLRFFDGEGAALGEYQYRYTAPALLQDGSFGMGTPILVPVRGAASFDAYVRAVEWQGSTAKFFDEEDATPLPVRHVIDEALSAEEAEAYRKVYGKRAHYVPVRRGELDFCVCGAVFHRSRRRVCPVCGAKFVAYDEMSPLDFERERSYREAAAMPCDTVRACEDAAERFDALAGYRDAATRAADCREMAEQILQKNKKRKKYTIIGISCAVFALLCVIAGVIAFALVDKAARGNCVLELQEIGVYHVVGVEDGVREIEIPAEYRGVTVTAIADEAFRGTDIESVVIPATIKKIGEKAFADCLDLERITFLAQPTTIGKDAFMSCTSLEGVYIEDLSAFLAVSFRSAQENPLYYAGNLYVKGEKVTALVIPEGEAAIGSFAFYGCTSIKSVTVPSSVKTVGQSAFGKCSSLKEVTFAEGRVTIGLCAFSDCAALERVTLPAAAYVGVDVFAGCKSICEATVPTTGIASLPKNALKTLVIAGDGTIPSRALYSCPLLESVRIVGAVTTIEEYAFADCPSLRSVFMTDTVRSIGSEAFADCTALSSVTISKNVSSIGTNVFENCGNIMEAVLPVAMLEHLPMASLKTVVLNGGTSVPGHAFEGTPKLRVVAFTVDCGIATIGDYAFADCAALESVTIPSSVKTIGAYAFARCGKLTQLTFDPDSQLTALRASAFADCTSLVAIALPGNVTSIGAKAFSGCTSLKSVSFDNTRGRWNTWVYKGAGWCSGAPFTKVKCTDGEVQAE